MKKITSLFLVMVLILSLGVQVTASEIKKLGKVSFENVMGFEIYSETDNNISYENKENGEEYIFVTYAEDMTEEVEDITEIEKSWLDYIFDSVYNEKYISERLSERNGVYVDIKIKSEGRDYYKTEKGIPFYYGEIIYKASAPGYNDKEYYNSSAIFAKGNDLVVIDYENNNDEEIYKLIDFLDTIEFTEEGSEPDAIKIMIDGEYIYPDSDPVIVNDRTLVPIRAVAEKLGYNVEWKPEERMVVINDENIMLLFEIDSFYMLEFYYDKHESKELDVAPTIINDRTYLPLRAVGEALGCDVDWDASTRTVIIRSK